MHEVRAYSVQEACALGVHEWNLREPHVGLRVHIMSILVPGHIGYLLQASSQHSVVSGWHTHL